MRILTEDNVHEFVAEMRQRFDGRRFSIAIAHRVDSGNADLQLYTGCTVVTDWCDRSPDTVRVMAFDNGRHYVAFSAGHYYWSFNCAPAGTGHDPDYQHTHFWFDHNQMEIASRAPCGDLHRYVFRLEPKHME